MAKEANYYNKGYYRELVKRNIQLSIINEIAQSVSVEMSFEEMMNRVTKTLKEVISYSLLSFFLLEEERLILTTGVPKDVPVLSVGTILPRENAMTWKVVESKLPLVRGDLWEDARHFSEDEDLKMLGVRSVAIVPLVVKNKVIGTLNVGSGEKKAYDEEDVRFLRQVADQLALLIENARLYKEATSLKERYEQAFRDAKRLASEMAKRNLQLALINELAKSVTVKTSLEEMLDNTASKLKEVMSYDLLSFCLVEEGRLVIKKGIPKDQPYLGEGTVLDPVFSMPSRVVREKKYMVRPLIGLGNEGEEAVEDPDLIRLGIRSAVMVPLIIHGQAIGTLNLGSKNLNAYSDEDALFLQQVADHFAIFIENARLYSEEERSKRAWEATFQAVADALFVVDRQHTIVRFNKATERLGMRDYGIPRIGQKCYEYFHPKQLKCRNCLIWEVFEKGRPSTQRMHLKSGLVWDVSAYPMYSENGSVNEVIVSIHDATEEVYLEAQLIQSAKLAAIGEIAAGVAHELNSPLTAIIGNTALLKRDCEFVPEDKVELLDDIKKCGIRCKKIIDNLKNFARQESYSFEPVSLNEVVEEALLLVAYQIENNGVEIRKKLDPGLPLIIGSRQHLEQALINFIMNAYDAVLDREKRVITIETGLVGREAFIKVSDTGCGIKEDNLTNIFAPFFTTKQGLKKGTGLGLSISRSIAEAHRGRIDVETKLGEGSTFTLMLPLDRD